MNVVLKTEVFLSVEYVWLKECDQFFMAHPVLLTMKPNRYYVKKEGRLIFGLLASSALKRCPTWNRKYQSVWHLFLKAISMKLYGIIVSFSLFHVVSLYTCRSDKMIWYNFLNYLLTLVLKSFYDASSSLFYILSSNTCRSA